MALLPSKEVKAAGPSKLGEYGDGMSGTEIKIL